MVELEKIEICRQTRPEGPGMGLTSIDFGDIYLSVISTKDFDPNVRKLSDGRTRKDRDIDGRITSVGDVIPGREVQSPDPGSELRS